MTALGNIEKLILATEISDKVVNMSAIFDENTKQAFKNLSEHIRGILKREPNMNSYGISSLKKDLLTYWNESITPDTEKFWSEIIANEIEYERIEPLRFALVKNRFKRVDQSIGARKYWNILKSTTEIKNSYSKTEIEQISNIISADEKIRLEVLKKCIKKKEIPQSQYLKFGECMVYMKHCGLLGTCFTKLEVAELHQISANFRYK